MIKLSTAISHLIGNPNHDSMAGKYYARFDVKHEDNSDSYLRKAYINMDLHTDGTYVKEKTDWLLMSKLDEKKKENNRNEFVDVVGHTLSKQIAPYALEHLKNSDVFFRTQKLADLNGFYKAFGMEVESIERADHISTQTEFLSFLLLKELLALTNALDEEKEICETAFIDFNQNHFLD